MKKFFSGILKLIKRHKLLTFICVVAILIVAVLFYVFFSLFIGGTNKYGDRLKGIDKVVISESKQDDVAEVLEEKEEVVKASVRIQGKIIYINIKFKAGIGLDKAKEIANSTLENFDDDEKKFYDIGYYLTQEDESEEKKGFVVTGTKNAKLDTISWIKS